MNIQNATFVFSQDIFDASVGNFMTDLINWAQKNEGKPVQIILNSGGGGVLAAIAMHEFIGELRACGHKVTVKVMGRAGSAAAVVLQAADVRIIAADSELLVHAVIPIAQQAGSTHAEVAAELERSKELTERTYCILCKRAGNKLNNKTIMSKTMNGSKDWWVNAKQALAHGLVDHVEKAPAFAA